ncbi:MAG: hypothetical protein EPO23_07495 [Xanthobacteraceae bacterium]|nr:MAG: hypothetical protein EPO23_07495 [Xanthobacteraceae bacterium]
MTDIADLIEGQTESYQTGTLISARIASVLPPLMALCYPWSVWCFYNSISIMREVDSREKIVPLIAATISIILTAVPSLISYLMLLRPVERHDQFAGMRWITYLAFAAPALFTLERVVFAGFRSSIDDRYLWVLIWALLVAAAAIGRQPQTKRQPAWTRKLQFAHGTSAAIILIVFLVVHLGNNFIGLLGAPVHIDLMESLRIWYRAGVVEVTLVGLFLFQMVSGARLASIRQFAPGDSFRTLQVATGVGLMAFLLAHMIVIFIVARWEFGVDTNWTFATSFKVGILGSLSNSRQVPYYWFALVVTLSHLACGLRVVLLAHGWRVAIVNRLAISIMIGSALFATATVAGMLGLRLG